MWNFVINVKLFHVLSSNIQNNEFSRTIICPCPPVSTLCLAMTCVSPLAVVSAWPGVTTRPRVMNNNSPNHRNLETIYTEIYCFNQLNTCFPKPLKPTQLEADPITFTPRCEMRGNFLHIVYLRLVHLWKMFWCFAFIWPNTRPHSTVSRISFDAVVLPVASGCWEPSSILTSILSWIHHW